MSASVEETRLASEMGLVLEGETDPQKGETAHLLEGMRWLIKVRWICVVGLLVVPGAFSALGQVLPALTEQSATIRGLPFPIPLDGKFSFPILGITFMALVVALLNAGYALAVRLIEQGRLTREEIHGEMGDVAAGNIPGRESDEEVIVAGLIGLGTHDVACAVHVVETALEEGRGSFFDFQQAGV